MSCASQKTMPDTACLARLRCSVRLRRIYSFGGGIVRLDGIDTPSRSHRLRGAFRRQCQQLETFGIPYEAHILSAHRTPAAAADFARSARANGFGVLICAAGMAAHLAGAFAGNSTLPVIGIPMKGGAADGLDALLATVQMPSGIPVATVAINGAKNAAVLAAQILAVSDDALAAKLDAQRSEMAEQIAAKEAKLQAELAH